MQTKVQKWGNSLAVRIPKPFVKEVHLASGTVIDLSVDHGRLLIDPNVDSEIHLTDLLGGITKSNLHAEIETGEAVGLEVW